MDLTTWSAVRVRGIKSRVRREKAVFPSPFRSRSFSCLRTGHSALEPNPSSMPTRAFPCPPVVMEKQLPTESWHETGPRIGQRLNEGAAGREPTEHVEGPKRRTRPPCRRRLATVVGGLDARLVGAHQHDQGSGSPRW